MVWCDVVWCDVMWSVTTGHPPSYTIVPTQGRPHVTVAPETIALLRQFYRPYNLRFTKSNLTTSLPHYLKQPYRCKQKLTNI